MGLFGLNLFDSVTKGGPIWIIGFIAFIIGSIVMSYLFLSKDAPQRNSKLGEFLLFDRFVIKKVIQVVNLICFVSITVISVCIVFSLTATIGALGFFSGLIGGAMFFCISQLLNRLVFEQVMLIVSVTTDVKDLRNRFVDGAQPAVASLSAATPVPDASPKAPAPVASTAAAASDSWTCACGKTGNTGRFCAECGSPRK